ncbi:calcium-binding protein [Acinetobacter indicus]|uniref:calcium-binding protein n=1 Tax=Acinetobacter indicus TaxID=756892 RepID=UPI0009491A82|nr:calcium-binding protein [Acinetobacter indicus]
MSCKDPSIAEAIGTGIADGAVDGFEKLFNGFGNKPYFFFGKLGNLTYISDMANAAAMGNGSEMVQKSVSFAGGIVGGSVGASIGASVAGAVFAGSAAAAFALPLAASVIVGTLVSYGIDSYFNKLECENKDPAEDFTPPPDADNLNNDYRIEYYDPLIIDLNNDGIISTIRENGYQGALFDHDNDGIRTATGWVSSEDGLLVRDINDDGIVNNGGELFGDNTLLSNGNLASNGIDALADLDSNRDGILDNNDEYFNEIKIWQDRNGDGISTADELLNLSDAGIISINLNTISNIDQVVDGGVIKNQINFSKNDGTSSIIADVDFDNNPLHARYSDNIAISAEIAILPNANGSGRLASLHHAASSSTELSNLLLQYKNATTREQQKNLLDNLMLAWAKTDPQYNNNDIDIMRPENLTWVQSSSSTNVIRLTPSQPLPAFLTQTPPEPENASQEIKNIVKFINAVLGIPPITTLYEINTSQIEKYTKAYQEAKDNLYKNLLNQTFLKSYLESVDVYTDSENMLFDFTRLDQLINQKYISSPINALEDLKDLLLLNGGLLEFGGWEKGLLLLNEWRDTLGSNPLYQEKVNQLFNELDINTLNGSNNNDFKFIQSSENNLFKALDGNDTLFIKNTLGLTVDGGNGDDVIVSGTGSDFLIGGTGRNSYIFYEGSGHDFVSYDNLGENFDKLVFSNINYSEAEFFRQHYNLVIKFGNSDSVTLIGALDNSSTKEILFRFEDQIFKLNDLRIIPLNNLSTTNDDLYLNGWNGIDILTANNKDNQIYAFEGDDTLIGGAGNDRLYGGNGQDIYIFQSGDGIDEIYETDFSVEQNKIVFNDINPIDILKVTFVANDLVIQYGLDKIILKNYIENAHNSELRIQFADQTIWQNIDLMARVTFEGSDNNDNIVGVLNDRVNIINAYAGDDIVQGNSTAINIIAGGAGNDQIHGGENTDTIQGGVGDDFIYALGGNDELNGGDGNDTLYGGEGNDLIVGGDGNDWLQGDGGADLLIGGQGDDSYDVDSLDTIIENPDEGYDTIFIENDFDLAGTNLEAIRLKGNGDFRAIGDEIDNELYGNAGNNYLDGKAGADIMSGGAGDDYYVVDQYDSLVTNPDGSSTLIRGDQVVEGLLNPAGYVFGDSGGIDTVEQWDDHRFYSQDANGDWFDTGNYHVLQTNIENLILKGQAKVGFGNELDNIIIGNDQDNFIDGQGGNDTYVYTKGGGTDTFNFEDINTATNNLIIKGYNASQMYGQKYGDSVLLGFKNSTDKIWLLNYTLNDYLDNEGNTVSYKFDEIIFESGQVLSTLDVDAMVNRAENNQAPIVVQYPSTLNVKIDEVLQYTFNNVISDPDLDDQLSFTLTMQTQDSNGDYLEIPEWVVFDSETLTITLSPHEGVDVGQLSFYLWGTDLYGVGTGAGVNINIQPSASTPIPGAIYDTSGNDNLVGGTEDNIFIYTGGQDTIQDAGGVDILRFSNGITFNEVGSGLTRWGNDLILQVNGSSANQVTLKNYFLGDANLIETIEFETGGQMTAEQLFNAFGLTLPSSGGESSSGSSDPVGDTTYNYSSGNLTINEVSGIDKVVFASGITFNQIGNYMSKSGNDLIFNVNGSTTNKITVKNFFLAGNYLVETFKFSTGEEITAEDIFGAYGLTLPSTGGTTGTGSSEVAGNTVYEYTTGTLTINEISGNDKVIFKNGITFNQIGSYLNMYGNDLILKLNDSDTNKVVVKDFFLGGDKVVETFEFETGGVITASQIFGAFGLTMPTAAPLARVDSSSIDKGNHLSSDQEDQDFGMNQSFNAEDLVQNLYIGDAGDNLFISDSAVNELFILNDGQDIIKLLQNTSGVTAVDYISDFKISEDQLDLSDFLDDSQVNSSNLDEFLNITYDENFKTNTISINSMESSNSQEILILTNQAEYLSVQDLLLNQSIVY